MNGMTIDISEVMEGLDRTDKQLEKSAAKGMALAGMHLLYLAITKQPTAPLDEGTLRGSGSVHVDNMPTGTAADLGLPTKRNDVCDGQPMASPGSKVGPGVIVMATGFNTPYATHLHENPDFEFVEPGSGGKFLEEKLFGNAPDFKAIAAKAIEEGLSHGSS